MLIGLRFWLIRLLAGKAVVILNAKIGGGSDLITIPPRVSCMIRGCHVTPWQTTTNFVTVEDRA
jgi:hypothetical protein